jgi:hypothetical protein
MFEQFGAARYVVISAVMAVVALLAYVHRASPRAPMISPTVWEQTESMPVYEPAAAVEIHLVPSYVPDNNVVYR